ncbi:MAG: iron-containing alcohol dehydrogenase [Anaerolineae bacterium]|nr:iron-containing alcohol dehydrogenase [Anaerolineae bacterium]
MPSKFEFAAAGRIVFGAGALKEAPGIAAELGQRALLVIRGPSADAERLTGLLAEKNIPFAAFIVEHEPTVGLALEGVHAAHDFGADVVIGLGGGSVIDTGKAIAALATNPGDPLDYLEVIGRGQQITKAPLPYLAAPTTAGTGADVTRNAVLASPEHRVKVSLRSPLMLPRAAVVDPELTYDLPPDVTASTGLDALTQVIEPYVSNRANPMTDALCREGMVRAGRSLRRAFEDGHDAAAREDMAIASLFGGLALANARLGAVHGFAGPIGGMYPAPHGAVCAALLPHVMDANMRALQARDPNHPALARYTEIARLITSDPAATAEQGVAWALELTRALRIPRLGEYGIGPADLPQLVEKSAVASSMQGNPIPLTMDELRDILARAL